MEADVGTPERLTAWIARVRKEAEAGMGVIDLLRLLGINPYTDMAGADWRGTDFSGCDLRRFDLTDCRLSYCDFTGANVEGAIFLHADLFMCTLHRADNVDRAVLGPAEKQYVEDCIQRDAQKHSSAWQVFELNKRMRYAAHYSEAATHFETLVRSGLVPDQYSASLLIRAAQSSHDAWEAYNTVTQYVPSLNEVVYVTLASKMDTENEARLALHLMEEAGLRLSTRAYNALISKTTTRARAIEIISEMRRMSLSPDEYSYNSLINRSDFDEAIVVLQEMEQDDISPRTFDLNGVLIKAESRAQIEELMEVASELDIEVDSTTCNILIRKSGSWEEALSVLEVMKAQDLERDQRTYHNLLRVADTFARACIAIEMMLEEGLDLDAKSVNLLCLRAPDRSRAFRLLRELDLNDISLEERACALAREFGTAEDISRVCG